MINPGDQNYMNIGRQRSTEGQSRRAYKRQRDRFDRKQVKKGQKAWRRSRVEKRTIEQDATAKLKILASPTANPALKANARKGLPPQVVEDFEAALKGAIGTATLHMEAKPGGKNTTSERDFDPAIVELAKSMRVPETIDPRGDIFPEGSK